MSLQQRLRDALFYVDESDEVVFAYSVPRVTLNDPYISQLIPEIMKVITS